MICTHSGIEVTQNNNLFLAGDVPDDVCKVPVECVFSVCVADSVGAYTLIRVTGPVECQEALGAATAWLNHSQQAVRQCKSYSGLVGALPLPEECEVLLFQGIRLHPHPPPLHVDDGSKGTAGPLQFGTSDVAGVARMRLSTTTNCLRDSNTGFFLEVYS